MKVQRIGGFNIGIVSTEDLLRKNYEAVKVDLDSHKWTNKPVSKSARKLKIVPAPYSMAKLLKLIDTDEYHSGCISAIIHAGLMQIEVKNSKLKGWLSSAEFTGNEDPASLLGEFLKYYLGCGNGFLLKMRNSKKEWVGFERLLPNEIQIVEKYDEYGFFKPDFIQVRAGKKTLFSGSDVIHFKNATHLSNAWGLACLPVAINIEILNEIKTFDYNNFKNGLMVDYFMIVEGGTLRDDVVEDVDGKEVLTDAFTEIQRVLETAKGNNKSHTTVLIETENKDAKIRLEPLRQQDRDGGFLSLKKDLREGIFAYHRVPARIVSQLIPGQLGGDNKSDMLMFYHFVVKPLQRRLALILAKEFNNEFQWNLTADDFNFGNLTEIFQSDDEKLFRAVRS
jgi:capsid portal protein